VLSDWSPSCLRCHFGLFLRKCPVLPPTAVSQGVPPGPITDGIWGLLAGAGVLGGLVGGGIVTLLVRLLGDQAQTDRVARYSQALEALKNEYSQQLEGLKASYSQELDEFRASAAQQKDAIATAIGALSHGYAASHAKVLGAYGEFWDAILGIRAATTAYLFPYQILVPEEYSHHRSNKRCSAWCQMARSSLA